MNAWQIARPALVLGLSMAAAGPAIGAPGDMPGVPWTGAVGVHRTVAEIVAIQGLETSKTGAAHMAEVEKEYPDRSHLPQAPGAMDVGQWPPAQGLGVQGGSGGQSITSGPQTPGIMFTGAALFGSFPTFSFPADAMGAVGPTQFLVFVNGRIASFDKNTGAYDGALNVDPDVFFTLVNSNGSSTSDPRIRYDRLSGRWFLLIINTSTPNSMLLAVSDAASNGIITPSTVFTEFAFRIDTPAPPISITCFADYPTLGIDANALYIGTSNFCGSPLTYNSADGFVVRKSSVLGAGPIVVTALRGLVPNASSDGPYVPQGVDNYDPAASEGYFIGVSNTLFGRLVLRRVGTPGGIPTVSANIGITVPSTAFPMLVPHLGNTGGSAGNLSATDDRLFAAHIRNGRLWTAHNVGVNNTGASVGTRTRNGSRWYELQGIASPAVPSVVQAGTVFTPSATNTTDQPHFWFPSIMVSGQGHALMGMSTAGTNNCIDATTTGRLAGDPLGTMATPTNYTASFSAYNPPGDPGGPGLGRRWGDYSFTTVDPIDDMTMYTIQMYCQATNNYACQVIKMLAPLPAAPISADDVEAGHASALSTVIAASTSGSGFFDPGSNLPGGVPAYSHLTASVTNDGVTGTPPTVNGVIYVDPTHVQLDLNTTLASPSLPGEKYSVTITNPDGQSASGDMILAVTEQTGVGDQPATGFSLGAVTPNPTASEAGVDFTLGHEARARITVLDLTGREVATLADGIEAAGSHRVSWSGNVAGARAAAGMYFMRYEAAGTTRVRRFVLLR